MLEEILAEARIHSVLLTNVYFDGLTGSPLVALDIADVFRRAGVDARIAACKICDPMASIAANRGVPVVDLFAPGLPGGLPAAVDLVWGQHWPAYVLALVQHGVAFRHLVLSSLSPFEPLEALAFLSDAADRLIFNSEENLAAQSASVPGEQRRMVLPNSLPTEWFVRPLSPPLKLKRLLAVSNHSSFELELALEIVEGRGVEVTRIGDHGHQRLVDVELIDTHDAVISIGHTVQKALARCRPVFVYGRFGGPGWLVPGGTDAALHANFSGRGFARRPPEALAAELLNGFTAGQETIQALALDANRRFHLERNLGTVLAGLGADAQLRRLNHANRRTAMLQAQMYANLSAGRVLFPAVANIDPSLSPIEFVVTTTLLRLPSFVLALIPFRPSFRERKEVGGNILIAGALLVAEGKQVAAVVLDLIGGPRFDLIGGPRFIGRHGLESPLFARLHPSDERARAARFEVHVPLTAHAATLQLIVLTCDGEEVPLAEVTIQPVP